MILPHLQSIPSNTYRTGHWLFTSMSMFWISLMAPAENTDGRNSGPTLDQAAVALRIAARDERFRSLSIWGAEPHSERRRSDAIPHSHSLDREGPRGHGGLAGSGIPPTLPGQFSGSVA